MLSFYCAFVVNYVIERKIAMGLISDVKAMAGLQKIKAGGTTMLSISQITNLIINLPDGKRNLLPEQFNDVYNLYKQMRKCKTRIPMDIDGYMDTAVKIIKEFDKIAPYEKYSGGNEIEFSILMQDIRKEPPPINKNIQDELINLVDRSDIINNDYINFLTQNGYCNISHDVAKAFLGVLILFNTHGKTEALNKLDSLIKSWINSANVDMASLLFSVSFLCGTLVPNGITSKEESDKISKKYSDMIMKKMMPGDASDRIYSQNFNNRM